MATLYEYYITNDDTYHNVGGIYWQAQTFTPSIAHKITSVKIKGSRSGTPGIATVGIRNTDVNNHPTGNDLCSGTTDIDTLPALPTNEWREITLGAGYDLVANTKYAIVIRVPTGSGPVCLNWRYDVTAATYPGGCREDSSDSGVNWTSGTPHDYMFEEWGTPSLTIPTVVTNAATSVASFSAVLNGEITDTGTENADERGFDYGLTDSYGSEWTEIGSYGVATFYSHEDVDDLSPYRTYHFRAKAHNSVGWGYGSDDTFKTLIAKPYETHLTPTRLYATTFEPEHLYEAGLISEHLYETTFEPIHLYEADLKVKLTETYKGTIEPEHKYISTLKATRKLSTVRYEYYNTGDNTADGLGGTSWDCQTFTPSTTHKILSVKLKLFRNKQTPYVTVGTITVGIRATDVNGKPEGDDLCSGTVDGDSLTIDTDGAWYGITLGSGRTLVVDTKYAIVIRAPDATSDGDAFYWRTDDSSPTYTRGNNEFSDDSGATWTTYTDYDMMFEEWGGCVDTIKVNLGASHKYWTTFKAEHKYTAKMEAK